MGSTAISVANNLTMYSNFSLTRQLPLQPHAKRGEYILEAVIAKLLQFDRLSRVNGNSIVLLIEHINSSFYLSI